MAISRAALLKELLPALNEVFGMEYENKGWAVFYDYCHEDMSYRIAKVEPWDYWEHSVDGPGARRHPKPGIMKIEKAPDELGAYAEAMRRLEGANK